MESVRLDEGKTLALAHVGSLVKHDKIQNSVWNIFLSLFPQKYEVQVDGMNSTKRLSIENLQSMKNKKNEFLSDTYEAFLHVFNDKQNLS